MLIGAPVVALLLLYTFSDTWAGRRLIEDAIGVFSGGKVEIRGLAGEFPRKPTADHVDVSDERGVWLTLDHVALNWSPFRLLGNRADIASFTADHLALLRMPVTKKTNEKSTFRVDVASMSVARADTGRALTGHAMSIALKGRLHYVSKDDASWNIRAARVDGIGNLTTEGVINSDAIRGRLTLREPADSVAGGLAGLPNLGVLAVDGAIDGPRASEHVDLSAHAGALDMRASGALDLVHRAALLDIAAFSRPMAPRADIFWNGIEFEGHLRGPFSQADLNGRLSVTAVHAVGASANSITGNVVGHGGRLSMNAQAAGLVIPGSQPMLFASAPVNFLLSARLDTASPQFAFEAQHPLLLLRGDATLGTAPVAHANLTLPKVGPLAALAGISLDGAAQIGATLSTANGRNRVALDGRLDATGAALLSRMLGRNAHLLLDASSSATGYKLDKLHLAGEALKVDATGTETSELRNISYNVILPDLSRTGDALAGNLAMHGTVLGKPKDFAFALTGHGDLATRGFAREPIEIALRATGLPTHAQGTFSATGHLDKAPLKIAARFDQANKAPLKINLSGADWRSVHARGNFSLPPDLRSVSGKTELRVDNLGDVGMLAGLALKGSLQAALDIESQKGRAVARVHGGAQRLDVKGTTASTAAVDGNIADPFGKPVLGLRVAFSGLAFQHYSGTGNVTLNGPLEAVATTATLGLKDPQNNPGQVNASGLLDAHDKRALLKAMSASYRGDAFKLTAPARFDFADGVKVDRLQLTSDKTVVLISGRALPVLALSASLRNATPDLIRPFAPSLNAVGLISLTAKLTGKPEAPGGTLALTATGLKLRGQSSLPPANVDAHATLHGNGMRLASRIDAGKTVALNISGDAPLSTAGRFNLKAKGTVDLASLDPFLAASGKRLRGSAVIDGGLSGTIANPSITGTAVLTGGDYQDYIEGLHLQAISARLEARGGAITVSELTGQAGHGTVSGRGKIAVWQPGIPVDISLTMKKARPLTTDRLRADLNADLKLVGKLRDGLALSGNVSVGSGEINVAESFPPSVAQLNIRRRNQRPQFAAQSPGGTGTLKLDLTVVAPGGLYVRGHGINAELNGRIAIKGTTGQPAVAGGFEAQRGDFNLAGKSLNIDKGRVTFDGRSVNGSFDPALDFAAYNTSGNITAKLAITGHASEPHVELTSSPSLPPDEVLSHLLFGENVSQLTAVQVAQVAEGLATLGGSGEGFNPLSAARRSLGLDRLAVGGTEKGNGASIEVGKNVSRGLYVGAKQDTVGGAQAQVQVDLTRHLKLQTTVSSGLGAQPAGTIPTPQNDRGSSVGLSYQFEY
jgi:translocation and assembly module TamB